MNQCLDLFAGTLLFLLHIAQPALGGGDLKAQIGCIRVVFFNPCLKLGDLSLTGQDPFTLRAATGYLHPIVSKHGAVGESDDGRW